MTRGTNERQPMTNQVIPEEAVEAAAKAIFAQQYDPDEWTSAVTGTRDRCKRDARVALEAAAPRLMSAAWEEGRQAEEDAGTLTRSTPNPYDAAEVALVYPRALQPIKMGCPNCSYNNKYGMICCGEHRGW
jgi:hypothetical protein